MKIQYLALFSVLAFASCGKKSTSKDSITTTRVRPPVQAAIPSKLLASSTYSLDEDTDYTQTCQTDVTTDKCMTYTDSKRLACIVKQRLFCKGPTEVLGLLNGLDTRLAEIEARAGGAPCLNNSVVDLTSQLTFPGDSTLTYKAFCKDSSIGLGFGKENGTWYLREANGAAAQVFSVTETEVVDGYLWLPSKDKTLSQSTGILRIHADKANKTFEMTGGGAGLGFCGMHFHSNATHVYLIGNPDGTGTTCDYNKDNQSTVADWVEICLKADDLSVATESDCATLKSSLTLKTHARAASVGNMGTFAAAAPGPTGLTVVTAELTNYLNDLFTKAGVFEGVSELEAAAEDK